MLRKNIMKKIAMVAVIPFVLIINSCEKATVKPITKAQKYNCIDNDLSDYLIAYYPFTNGSIDNYLNTGYNLKSINPVIKTNDRHNNSNCAIYINQNNQDQALYFYGGEPIGDADILDKEYSVSIWYKPLEADIRNDGYFETLIGNHNALPAGLFEDNWYVGLFDCRRPTAVFNKKEVWDNLDFQQFGTCNAVMNYYSERWIHLVITYKNGIIKMYINGKLESENSQDRNTNIGKNGSNFLTIGNDYRGNLDEIMIFNKGLTDSEVVKLYSSQPCCEGEILP